MANYKRKKPRKQVKCNLCTDARQVGNSLGAEALLSKRKEVQIEKEQTLYEPAYKDDGDPNWFGNRE